MSIPASLLYGRIATWRRRYVLARPERRRRLRAPVVSVGNLAVGGSGKTPVVAHVAALLREAGERPAILSRGYARARHDREVVVVGTADHVVAGLDEAGDEPLMLARSLEGVAVVVAADRHLAGCVAESRLGCTVHVLDDGFQHVQLVRDVDLLLATPADLHGERVLPAGRLREPVEAARMADALLVTDGELADVATVADGLGLERRFVTRRSLRVPRMIEPYGTPPRQPRSAPVLAVAGIARPERFFSDLASADWTLVASEAYPDHHRFTRGDVEHVAARVRETGAALVLTTEKDLVRWLPLAPLPFPLAWVPLDVRVEPSADFGRWLVARVRGARQARAGEAGSPGGAVQIPAAPGEGGR
jgi:tetraacyldisaccharide 4'-kinase